MAWEVFPYPCIGGFWFLSFGLAAHPHYETLLAELQSDPSKRFLDLGCCLGQDLRKLVYDGAPQANLYGSDIFADYEDAGYALFRDKNRFQGHFIAADIFDEDPEGPLVRTEGTWDVVSIFMFLHTFDLESATRACKRILKLLKNDAGSYVIGTQTGELTPKEFPLQPPFVEKAGEKTVYRHSRDSFVEMWEKVGREEGVALKIWAETQEPASSVAKDAGKKTFFGGDRANYRIHFRVEKV